MNQIRGSIGSIGYEGIGLDEFLSALTDAGVNLVVDVRETPWSRKRGFSKSQLHSALADVGIDYHHAKTLGNPKDIRRSFTTREECLRQYDEYLRQRPELIDELSELLSPRFARGERIYLLCFERDPAECHRSVILEHWLQRGGAGNDCDEG